MLIQWSDGTLQTWDGSANGAIQSPAEKQWWDAFIGMQEFMGEMQAAAINAAVQSGHNVPTPQTDDMSGEMGAAIADMWYMSNPSMWPNANPTPDTVLVQQVADLTTYAGTTNSVNLQIDQFDSGGFSVTFGGNVDSLTPIDQANGIFDFNIGGTDLIAQWLAGAAPPPDPNDPSIVITGTAPDHVLYTPSGYSISYDQNHFNPGDGFGGMGASGHGSMPISAAMRQAVINKLSSDSKFWDFKLNGVDIDHAILNALAKDKIIFSDDGLNGADAFTNKLTGTIQVATAFENDPVPLALVLAHEGLHQAIYSAVAPGGDSQYEEALGKLVTAYVYSGLSSADQQAFSNDSNSTIRAFYNDTMTVVGLSNQGNFQGIIAYDQPMYGSWPMYPAPQVYDIIKGSF